MNKRFLKLLKISLVITTIFFAVQALLLVKHFGVFSIVEEIPLDFKKTNQQNVHLLKGQKTSAAFKAREDNLGILFIRLVKFGQGRDTVAFRIKKEGEDLPAGRQGKWYHESKFRGDQVQNNQYFPLGFPPITNSKNNIYVFEIESLAGDYNNGIGVIKDKPAALMYKYSAGDLANYKTLFPFTYKKFIYALKNINYLQGIAVFVLSLLLAFLVRKSKITPSKTVRFLLILKEYTRGTFRTYFKTSLVILNEAKGSSKIGPRQIIRKVISYYRLVEKKTTYFLKQTTHWFIPTKIYLLLLNTNWKKRLAIGILLFLLALTYRFSSSLVNQDKLFYAGLGGQGDYDQFIRAATCALNFCSPILGQNFLIEASILGVFYEIFGFTGGLKAYLYLMLITSSIVATLPHFLLSRKTWITLGGLIGSLYLATSDFLTHMALNFPPDNGSLFTFSMFFIVYFLTLQAGTIRWLLFFGLMGTIDGLNKALFLINDLSAFLLFVPVFFYEKAKRINKLPFFRFNLRLLFYSTLPLLVFVVIYSAWEYITYVKFSAPYFLRGLLLSRGESYISYTAFSDSSFAGSIVSQLFYLSISAIVMLKRLIQYADLQIFFLAPIFLGLLFFSFIKVKFPTKKFILMSIFATFVIVLLTLIKNNYFKIHEIFAGEYIVDNWTDQTYIRIFLLSEIIILFILNFKYTVLKLALPIIPYVVMLTILTKNSPFARLNTHVIAWSVILLAYLIDFLMMNINKYSIKRVRIILGPLVLILFIYIYIFPKMTTMGTQLNSGMSASQSQVGYLKWVEEELPKNAVILAGGKSDLVTVGENIKRPIVYNTLWHAAVLIKPKEIPGVTPSDFSIIPELKNKDNFKINKYIILEDDIYIWRDRVAGVVDNVFATSPNKVHADDYTIKVYKFNPTLKKAIYELISL